MGLTSNCKKSFTFVVGPNYVDYSVNEQVDGVNLMWANDLKYLGKKCIVL